jgi:hypothetical protein
MPTFSNGETGLSVRNKLNKAINLTDRVMIVDDVTQLASLVYDLSSQWGVAAGMQVMTAKEGFLYDVLAGGASTFDIQPGAVKLDLLPGANGAYNFRGMLPAANGSTDDYPLLAKLLAKPARGSGFLVLGPSIYFPYGNYFMGQTIDLKKTVHLYGDAKFASTTSATLTFAANTTGIIVNRSNTINGGIDSPETTGADDTVVEGLYIKSSGGTDRTKAGIWIRARCCIRACFVKDFPGNGIQVIAGAGAGGANEGNANVFYIENVHCAENKNHGFYADGADANAGTIVNLDCNSNGRCGIFDSSFLGNAYIGCHVATNGLGSAGGNIGGVQSSVVSFGGRWYQAHWLATETQLAATTPGTNANVWIDVQAGGPTTREPLWQSGQPVGTYFVGYGYLHYDVNADSAFIGCYCESDNRCVFLGKAVVIGGAIATIIAGSRIGAAPSGLYGVNTMQFGNTGLQTQAADGQNYLTFRGVDQLEEVWRFKRLANGSLRFDNADLGNRVVYEITGPAASVPWKFSVGDFLLGGRRMATGTAAPTTGTWAQGDYMRNSSPAVGQPKGWICTVSGTPGTWVSEGNL